MRPHRCRGPVWCSRIRLQINAACSVALCCRLVPLIPSHDRCAKLLLALFRFDVLATDGRLMPPRPETGRRLPGPLGPRRCAPSCSPAPPRTSIGGLRVSIPASHELGLAAAWTCRLMMTLLAPMISRRLSDRSPIFVVAPSLCLPPVECWRGVRPSQAAKSRALRKVSGGGARVAMAVAISGPIPGTVISRRATSFSLARRAISVSSLPISASNCASAATRTLSVGMASAGRSHSGSSMIAISFVALAALVARPVRTRPDALEVN